jgi:carbon dioxide concentrating mechanism protein CcmO
MGPPCRDPALGLLETAFVSITAMACDAALKAANVRLLGLEPIGTEVILSRFAGSVADVTAGLAAAEARVRALGSEVAASQILARPAPDLSPALQGPNSINPLYGGREYFLPSDYTEATVTMKNQAIGILETQGLTAVLNATDAMLKAANVTLVGKEKIGAAYVTIIIRGDVAAVEAALRVGAAAVGSLGKLIAAHVIARPHEDLLALLPK